MVSEDKQIFHCFGCGEGGDIFSFVEKIENNNFIEALELLAPKAGVKLEQFEYRKESGDKKATLLDTNTLATSFYHQVLLKSIPGQKALKYLHDRGLSDLSIDKWQIGFAPAGWDNLLTALGKRKHEPAQVIAAGLAIRNAEGRTYDRFRNRIIFPIKDARSRIVGFTSRIIDPADEEFGGKYVNTPQTALYNKSEVLFGLDQAKGRIKETGYAIMVEGNMDVIMSHQAGVTNVIATSGTALTAEHLKILKRFTNALAFCFDADSAGQNAFMRGFALAQQEDMDCSIIILPKEANGQKIKDPDDMARIDPAGWQAASGKLVPVMDFLVSQLPEKFKLGSDTGKKEAIKLMLPIIQNFSNRIVSDHWLAVLAQRIGVNEDILKEEMRRTPRKTSPTAQVAPKQPSAPKERQEILLETLYTLLVNYPKSIPGMLIRLETLKLEASLLADLYSKLKMYYNSVQEFNYSNFLSYLQENLELLALSNNLALRQAEVEELSVVELDREINRIVSSYEQLFHKKELARLQALLAEAETRNDLEQIKKLMASIVQYNELITQYNGSSQKN